MGFETYENEIIIPQEFDDIKKQKYFSKTYENIVSRYGDNFDGSEIKAIKSIRTDGCNRDCKGNITEGWARVFGNRIDKYIFEHRNPEFINLDKTTIRVLNNANKQRELRKIAIRLKDKLNNLSTEEIKIIEKEFLNANKKNTTPNFDKIFNKIQQLREKQGLHIVQSPTQTTSKEDYSDISFNNTIQDIQGHTATDTEPTQKQPQQILSNIAQNGILGSVGNERPTRGNTSNDQIELPSYLEELRYELLNSDKNYNQHQAESEGYFHDIADFLKKYGIHTNNEETRQIIRNATLEGFIKTNQGDIQSLKTTQQRIFSIYNIESNGQAIKQAKDDMDIESYIDEEEDRAIAEMIDKDPAFLKQQKFLEENGILTGKDYRDMRILQLKLTKKLQTEGELSEGEQAILDKLNIILGENGEGIAEFIILYEIKQTKPDNNNTEFNGQNTYNQHIEKLEGDMNSLNPDTIVIYNTDIHNYIFKKENNEYYTNYDEDISLEYRKSLYAKLVNKHKGDSAFQESIKYLDEYGNIDKEKVKTDHIDEESIRNNYETINKMIHDLAEEEFRDKERIKNINDICTRKCIMSTCFRALSAYFDTSNNNGENFADEFEIEDINENIGFDEETGIITMNGKIKGDNHIGLYYDTKKGELSFDNFLGFDSNVGYILGKSNGMKEKINITLPTMDDMEYQSNKVNKDLIHSLTISTPQYIRVLSKCLKESLRLGCFQGFIGTNMDVNKQFVKEFNEKNILKQEIFKSIYSKYYDDDSIKKISEDKLVINEGNSKEQFELIKLISDSIDNCNNANELLRFRNLINEFDQMIGPDSIYIKRDKLLYTLFANNLNDSHDFTDQSIQIMNQENPDLSTNQSGFTNYKSNFMIGDTHNKSLNYYTFLDLISEDHGTMRTINLDTLDNVIDTIKKRGEQLLDKREGTLWTNYLLKVAQGDLPDIANIGDIPKDLSLYESNPDAELERKLGEIS